MQKCKDKGGILFEPKDQIRNDEVFKVLQQQKRSDKAWIGISDQINEGTFKYSSNNQNIVFANWNDGKQNK